jgi:hypothetical protein
MTNPITASPIEAIDFSASIYAKAREVLAERVANFEAEVQAVRKRLLPGIKTAAAAAADAQGELSGQVTTHPDLFIKPRTMTLRGIKVGFQKGKGKITWDDDDKVVAAIRRHFAQDLADTLIAKIERPVKDALAQLPAADLRRLGITVEEAGDHVYIKAADSEIDKLVAQILEEGAIDEAEAAAAK